MGEEIKSNAEKKMYDVLQELRTDDTYVLHSLGLPRHQNKIYGEIDFVVVCKRGVACLEIKGGRVECREGKWFFTDRYGIERQKPEGPFAQVTGNMFSLLTELKGRFPSNPHMKNILVACGVVFPDIEFKSSSQEIISEIVYDSSGVEIKEFLHENGEEVQKISYLDMPDLKQKIKEIIKQLRSEKVIPSEIVFLAPKKYANSVLAEVGVEVNELGDEFDDTSPLPKYATIQGFKGLDAKIVILVDVDNISKRNFAKFMYIAGTRARTLLYVVASEEYWRRETKKL